MHYVRTQPSNVYVVEFSGHTEIGDTDLRYCVGYLSDECELLPTDNMLEQIHAQARAQAHPFHPPRIYFADEGETEEHKTFNECFWECILGAPVAPVAGVGAGAVASGLIPKKLVGASSNVLGQSSKFTSVPSIVARYYPHIDQHLIKRTGNLLTGKAPVVELKKWPPKVYVRMQTSGSPLRFIGRWIPAFGWGLLAADLVILDRCIANCRGEKTFLRNVWDEFFGIKPAY